MNILEAEDIDQSGWMKPHSVWVVPQYVKGDLGLLVNAQGTSCAADINSMWCLPDVRAILWVVEEVTR
jgi:hypothetical protein